MGVTAAVLTSPLRCVPRNGSLEAAEPDSNPGRSLPAGNLHATCLLQPRGTFTTSGQHSSMAAKGFKDKSAQGLPPTRMAWSQAHMPWGSRSHPGASISSWSWRKVIWQRPSKAPGGTITATSDEGQDDHPLPELSRAQSSPHRARTGFGQSLHCSRPPCYRGTSVPPLRGAGENKKYCEIFSRRASLRTDISVKLTPKMPGPWTRHMGHRARLEKHHHCIYCPSVSTLPHQSWAHTVYTSFMRLSLSTAPASHEDKQLAQGCTARKARPALSPWAALTDAQSWGHAHGKRRAVWGDAHHVL